MEGLKASALIQENRIGVAERLKRVERGACLAGKWQLVPCRWAFLGEGLSPTGFGAEGWDPERRVSPEVRRRDCRGDV